MMLYGSCRCYGACPSPPVSGTTRAWNAAWPMPFRPGVEKGGIVLWARTSMTMSGGHWASVENLRPLAAPFATKKNMGADEAPVCH